MLVSWATSQYKFSWPTNYHIPKVVQKWVRPIKNGVNDVQKSPDNMSQSTLSFRDLIEGSISSAVQNDKLFTEAYFSAGPKQYSEIIDRKWKNVRLCLIWKNHFAFPIRCRCSNFKLPSVFLLERDGKINLFYYLPTMPTDTSTKINPFSLSPIYPK